MNKLFTAIFSIRYLAVIAVIGPFFGAALMLLIGAIDVVNAYRLFFGVLEPSSDIEASEAALITLVASVDHFLFATILMIFGIGLYSLFFGSTRGDVDHSARGKRLSWNHVKNLGGMDEMLLKVIIMLLAVSFLEFVLRAGMGTLSWQALVTPIAIVGLGLSLRWMSASADSAEELELIRESTEAAEALRASPLDELERLAALREQGHLSAEEFDQMKQSLLSC